MEFAQILETRRTVRAYRPDALDGTALGRVLEAARHAPSAGNLQAYHVSVARSHSSRQALARAAFDQRFVEEAPVSLVFFADPLRSAEQYGARGTRLYAIQDATIAATFAMLAVVNEGLACGWVGSFDDQKVRLACGERTGVPVAILPIGRPAESPEPTPRRSARDLFHEI